MRKILKKLGMLASSFGLFMPVGISNNEGANDQDTLVRTSKIKYEDLQGYENVKKYYDNVNVKTNDNLASVTGDLKYNEKLFNKFNEVAFEFSDITKDSHIEMKCDFNFDTMCFYLETTLFDESNIKIKEESFVTEAIVTETGGLDAHVELWNGISFNISDYASIEDTINDCSLDYDDWYEILLGTFGGYYVLIANIAIQIKADRNYDYNKKLQDDGNGVNKGNYIYYQSETEKIGYKSAGYRFGFAQFNDVGCEVAAAYNLMISLNKAEDLYVTINRFEKYGIIIAASYGNLGSNPNQIHDYLDIYDISYKKIKSWEEFQSIEENRTTCKIIMARWNKNPWGSLHTFFVNKHGKNNYTGYNFHGSYYAPEYYTKIDDFNDGNGFIVGYVI